MNESTRINDGPGTRSLPIRSCRFLRALWVTTVCLTLSLILLGTAPDAYAASKKQGPEKTQAVKAQSAKSSRQSAPTNKKGTSSKNKGAAALATSSASSKKKRATKSRRPYAHSLLPADEREALLERGIFSGYGLRAVSSKGRTRVHKGIDISAPSGSKIMAYNDGKVVFSGRDGAYGISIIVLQLDGRLARYAHMSKAIAQEGDEVTRGQHIGAVGSTGRTTGPHLHFELVDEGEHLDPAEHVWLGSELVLAPADLDPSESILPETRLTQRANQSRAVR